MVYLFGASGHAKVIIESLELEHKMIGGLIDVNPLLTRLSAYPVYQKLPNGFDVKKDGLIVSIGGNAIRKKVVNQLSAVFITSIHPSSNLSKWTTIGEGTVIMAGVSVNADCKIGKHVILNTNCSVDHDCVIGDFVHVSPNVALAGDVSVGEGTHIGIGACVIQGIKIGKWATIGAGATLIKDVPDFAVVVGNPGKIIKFNQPNDLNI
ncbi:acetyltransferase [Flavobacterium sp.]|uniref:acetyltransferase n=1 Tax=Flavobacterium sp. TaxID=239 RepID=UPI002B4B8C58|nr:acetyltransferase [Flavobacterium sp.]HLF51191.1 acetyltransferase [Flavobacterium sp.]